MLCSYIWAKYKPNTVSEAVFVWYVTPTRALNTTTKVTQLLPVLLWQLMSALSTSTSYPTFTASITNNFINQLLLLNTWIFFFLNTTSDTRWHIRVKWSVDTEAGPPSSCLPPWFDTMMPWTPCSTASSASSLVRIPLMITGSRVMDCSQYTSFQLMEGSKVLAGIPYSSGPEVSCL